MEFKMYEIKILHNEGTMERGRDLNNTLSYRSMN